MPVNARRISRFGKITCMSDTKAARAGRLRQVRSLRYTHGADAARAMHVPISTYLNHEGGHRDFKRSAAKYARFLKVNYTWLVLGVGPMKIGGNHPVIELFENIPPDKQIQALEYLQFLGTKPG